MWCYQKPGFEALLMAELQRQQQCSQFCDTLLKAEGVSVPVHGCILSAISPHISATLSSMPQPHPGQSRLLDFKTLGACTLLSMVRLLYSGEMAGEGEKEKQEAISAAAKLGIHGLVEVRRRDCRCRAERAEVGVQTDPEEDEGGGRGRWKREVREEGTFLWKARLTDWEKDSWTQTEELQINKAPPPPEPMFETIDMAAFQSLGQTAQDVVPYVPLSLLPPVVENQTPSSAPVEYSQDYSTDGQTSVVVVAPPYVPLSSFSSQMMSCAQGWWAGPQGPAGDVEAAGELEEESVMKFQDDIPGYINYILNPEREEDSNRGRARGRRRQRAAGARRAGASERRARRPQARTGGRRGGSTQMVIQEVGVNPLQKLFLQRWGTRTSKTGQGGGAAGRKLDMKTRQLLKTASSCRRRKVFPMWWEISPSRDGKSNSKGGAGNKQRGQRNKKQSSNKEDRPVGQPRRARAKRSSTSSPSLRPSPSSATSYVSPAMRLRPFVLPLPAPPPQEEQPELIDHQLEEVMMGLDIIPNNKHSCPHFQPPPPARIRSSTPGGTLSQNEEQCQDVVVVEEGAADFSSANTEVVILQEQGGGEVNEMLENILLSFEQHCDNRTTREDLQTGGQSCSLVTNDRPRSDGDEAHVRRSPSLKESSGSSAPHVHTRGTAKKVRKHGTRQKRKRKCEFLFSLDKKRMRKPFSSSDSGTKIVLDRVHEQLQQMPVVKLERSFSLPVRVTQQICSCQSLHIKKTSSSPGKFPAESLTQNQRTCLTTKTYQTRTRFTGTRENTRLTGHWQLRPRKRNAQPLSSSHDGETDEEEVTVQSEDEAEETGRIGHKKGAEAVEETSDDDATMVRKICFDEATQRSSKALTPPSGCEDVEPAETEDVTDVVSVSQISEGDSSGKEEREEKPVWSESSNEERINLDSEDAEKDRKEIRVAPTLSRLSEVTPSQSEVTLGSTMRWGEDGGEYIDVTGGCGPIPHPAIIDWSPESSGDEDEDEDVDIIGETPDYASSAVFTTIRESELVNRYHEVF